MSSIELRLKYFNLYAKNTLLSWFLGHIYDVWFVIFFLDQPSR